MLVAGLPTAVISRQSRRLLEHSIFLPPALEEFQFNPKALEAIRQLLTQDFYVVVVTNQAGIERGMVSIETVEKIHARLIEETSCENKRIQAIYTCPHRSDTHCTCRKPGLGLLRRASFELNIDLRASASYLVGDSESDIQAGTRAGCITIQIKDQAHPVRTAAKHVASDLSQAVEKILELEGRNSSV